jgi:hypothetical protein
VASHVYTRKGRAFTIVLSGAPNLFGGQTSWSAETVTEKGKGAIELDLDIVGSSSEHAALAQVQFLIDQFVSR